MIILCILLAFYLIYLLLMNTDKEKLWRGVVFLMTAAALAMAFILIDVNEVEAPGLAA